MNDYCKKLGDPDIAIAGLQIWIHNRCYPESENWLNVTVHCGAQGSSVRANGDIIHLSEISHLLSGVEKLNKSLKGKVEMQCMEPYLSVGLEVEKLGHINMKVDITPDHLLQKHTFLFEIDQSYLPKLINECKMVLEKYPIIGKT